MSKAKKLFSLVLAVVLLVALAVPAAADEASVAATTYTITIQNTNSGHTYEAYQIFTGDIAGSTLSTIQWGSGVSEEGITAAQTKYGVPNAAGVAKALEGSTEAAQEFAKFIANYLVEDKAEKSAMNSEKTAYIISGLSAGYYLVKDQDDSLSADAHDSYTGYILRLVGNVTVNPKADIPTIEKYVYDINDTDKTLYDDPGKSADHDIGDNVPFYLHVKLGDKMSDYTEYELVIYDTMSQGLTYNNDAVVKYGTHTLTENEHYTISADPVLDETTHEPTGETKITITFDNILGWEDVPVAPNGSFYVDYTAKLNEDAVIGGAGNPNTVYMTYTNNPYKEGTGRTPDDTVVVFTYKLVVDKVDSGKKPLAGATFKLEKANTDGAWELVKEYAEVGEATSFSFVGLDDGFYKLTETNAPGGYNKIDPIEFHVVATHDTTQVTELTGNPKSGAVTISHDKTEGSLSVQIVNEKGAILPSTGGMGTTLFYLVGGLMVAAAVVLLVTKKRMNTEA